MLIDIIAVAHPNFINIALIIPDIHKKKNGCAFLNDILKLNCG